MADSSVPHRSDIRPSSRPRTKANRTEALPRSGRSGLHSSRRTGTWGRASALARDSARSEGGGPPRELQFPECSRQLPVSRVTQATLNVRSRPSSSPPPPLPGPPRPRAPTHARTHAPAAGRGDIPGLQLARAAGGGRERAPRPRPRPGPAFSRQVPCTHCLFGLHPLSFAGSGSSPSALGRPACQVPPAVTCQHVPPVPIPTFLCPVRT